MNNLDELVKDVFITTVKKCNIISISNGVIEFDNKVKISTHRIKPQSNKPISLDNLKTCHFHGLDSYEIFCGYNKINPGYTSFTINVKGMYYDVPELSRKEFADVADTFEEKLQEFEINQLENCLINRNQVKTIEDLNFEDRNSSDIEGD